MSKRDLERHRVEVSRGTLRKWMVETGRWLSRRQHRAFHQPRLRRESYGELVQIDGSEHRWFENRGDPCTLLVFIRRRDQQAHSFLSSASTTQQLRTFS